MGKFEQLDSFCFDAENLALKEEQFAMLEMSEEDIKNGKLISQEAMVKRNLEWLNAMN